MDELRRIVDGTNSRYIEEVKGRWTEFCTRLQFYSVWKKVLKPPFPLDVRSGKLLFHIYMYMQGSKWTLYQTTRTRLVPSTFSFLSTKLKFHQHLAGLLVLI